MIVKKCVKCGSFYKSELKNPINCCNKPECQKVWAKRYAQRIIRSRNIPMDYFDVYDTQYPTDSGTLKYERVCRACGQRLLTKSKKYSPYRRWCKEHNFLFGYNASEIRDDYIVELTKQNIDYIKDNIDLEISVLDEDLFSICEECKTIGAAAVRNPYHKPEQREIYAKLPKIQVHHKKEVHTLTADEFMLIFDRKNLVALCKPCHNKKHTSKKSIVGRIKDKNHRLDEFLGGVSSE